MKTAQIRTADAAWVAQHGRPGPDGRTIVDIVHPEPLTFAGRAMVRFQMAAPTLPADWGNQTCMAPAEWVA